MTRVRLFAVLREMAGAPEVAVEAETVGALLSRLGGMFGSEFERIARAGSVVMEGERVGPDRSLAPAEEVAVLPPVSGGAFSTRGAGS